MFSGEEVIKRLDDIRDEIGHAPDLAGQKLEITNLAIVAGQADAALNVAYRMVVRLINDIQDEIAKDEKKAEEDRKWLEEWKAKEAAAQGGKDPEAPDAE